MHTQDDLRKYLNQAEQQLQQTRRFEDDIRHLSMVLYILDQQNSDDDSSTSIVHTLSTWLQSFLIHIYDTSELIAQHITQLTEIISRPTAIDTPHLSP